MKINTDAENTNKILLLAQKKTDFPEISEDGFVIIPEQERKGLEENLEMISNFLSVFGKCTRNLSSATPSVAFIPENKDELNRLEETRGILNQRRMIDTLHSVDQLDFELINKLTDRLHAVALLAEAHSHSLTAGKFHEFVRIFESAFALRFSQLQKKLLQFLRPAYGYTSKEIKNWITTRDPLTHADGKKSDFIFLDSDTREYVHRMEQAVYDVLFNKKTWHDRSSERREIWRPVAITTSPTGNVVIKQNSAPRIEFQILDELGIYPMDMNAVIKDPPEEWWYKMEEPI